MFPTSVTAWAIGDLFVPSVHTRFRRMGENTDVYGRKLTVLYATPGVIVRGACDIIRSAVAFTDGDATCARYCAALVVAYIESDVWSSCVVIGRT